MCSPNHSEKYVMRSQPNMATKSPNDDWSSDSKFVRHDADLCPDY